MKTCQSHLIQFMCIVFATILGGCSPAWSGWQDGAPALKKGMYLKLIYSANDEVCHKLLEIYDAGVPDRPDMVNGKYVYPVGKMFPDGGVRHDDDPMFIRWRPFQYPFTDAFFMDHDMWSEFDIDNDGVDERVMRKTSSHKYQWLNDTLYVFENLDRKQLRSYRGDEKSLWSLSDYRFPGSNTLVGYSGEPLHHYPGLDEEIKHQTEGWFQGCTVLGCPDYAPPTYLSPFIHNGETYLSFFRSVLLRPSHKGVWGVVQRFNPDLSADDICYFELTNSFKLQIIEDDRP